MNRIHKTSAIIAAGVTFIAACFGVQTFYTDEIGAAQVAVRTPITQSSEIFGGGYESTSKLTSDLAATQLATSSTTGSLQSSLESEAAERKTQDEKISKSIGSINNTLLGYIGSTSTSKIGDGTLRGAIGNTSIAGIGIENNITSAISGLNGKIGSTDILTSTNKIGDGTLTGAISSLNSNIANLSATVSGIISYGTNTNGDYFKFSDGTLICTKTIVSKTAFINAWGSFYETPKIVLGNWAYAFKGNNPRVSISSFCANDSYYAGFVEPIYDYSTTSIGYTYLSRPTSTTSVYIGLDIIGVGRWK